MENICLILIDLQNDYFPGGNMVLVGIEEAAANAQRLLKRFREIKLPVIHVQHVSTRPGAAFDLGFTCTVSHDACATKDLKFREETVKASHVHTAFLAALSGIYADILSTEEILRKML